jgi:hypothetical protein
MTIAEHRIPELRLSPDNAQVLQDLGPLANLVGTWEGRGFNLIARPDFHDRANLYLQLNQTHESFRVSPIGSAIPNRGFGQDDINMYGADYLQKIHDHGNSGALHFEPGLWVYQPDTNGQPTTFPPENVDPAQLVHRMGSIPHGNALLASGTAQPFTGPPTLPSNGTPYNGSIFPSFNSTPFLVGVPPNAPPGTVPDPAFNAAGSSDAGTAAANPGIIAPFNEYNLLDPVGLGNPRSPFDTTDAPLPDPIDGQKLQDVVNDPILLLQAKVQEQAAQGDEFEGTVLNISSKATIKFNTLPDAKIGGPTQTVTVAGADGGVENIRFLDGVTEQGQQAANAHTAVIYATFWITTVHPRNSAPYQQLQYIQMVELDFPIQTVFNTPTQGQGNIVDLGWPHISLATLRKSFSA